MNGGMKALLDHQKEIRSWLRDVNRKIARLEEQYLDDTTNGNIIRGWETDARNSTSGGSRLRGIDDKEKLFSNSSYRVWVASQSMNNGNTAEAYGTSSTTGAPIARQSSSSSYSNISNYTYNKSDLYPPSVKRRRKEKKEDSDDDYF